MSKTLSKVDLTLLKKLVSELELSLTTADGMRKPEGSNTDFIVEMSKAAGLCAGVMSESAMLVSDVQAHVLAVQGGAPPAKTDLLSLEKLLGSIKGPGSGTAN